MYLAREYHFNVDTLKTKIEVKKFLILIGLKKLRSAKNSAPGLISLELIGGSNP